MYKVFINDFSVEFILANTFSHSVDNKKDVTVSASEVSIKRIKKILSECNQSLLVLTDDVELAWANIEREYKYVPAAGGVVFNAKNEILIIYRNGNWDLPKGKIEAGENEETAALREVEEECGISGHQIIKPLLSTWHTYDTYGPNCLKRTYWFEMRLDKDVVLVPQGEEGIEKVEWIKISNLEKVFSNTYQSIKLVLDTFLKNRE